MLKGTIRRVVDNNTYGFIRVGDKEYFFHRDDYLGNFFKLREDWRANQVIEVLCEEVVGAPKGPRVTNVSRIE